MTWGEAQALAYATGVAIRRAAWRRWIWAPQAPASRAPIWMCRYVDRGAGGTGWTVRDVIVQARPAGYSSLADGPFFEAADFGAGDWTAAVWEGFETFGMERPGTPWEADPEPGGGDQPSEDPPSSDPGLLGNYQLVRGLLVEIRAGQRLVFDSSFESNPGQNPDLRAYLEDGEWCVCAVMPIAYPTAYTVQIWAEDSETGLGSVSTGNEVRIGRIGGKYWVVNIGGITGPFAP